MRVPTFAAWSIALALGATACKKSEQDAQPPAASATAGTAAPGSEAQKPAKLIYVSPDPLGVNPFLLMGKRGIEKAAAKHGAELKVFESEDPTTRKENLRAAVAEGATLVVVLGFEFNDIIAEAAEKHPGVQFLIVDQCVEERPDNLHCAVFREHESSFLLGAEAAALSKRAHLGVVAALDIPFMHRFTDGFAAGARHVAPEIQVDVRWVGGQNPFADPVRAKELALALHAAGADIIFAATSGGDFGVFEAAAEKDFRLMGVDVNLCPNAPGRMYDSALKRLDSAMVEAIDQILGGAKKFSGSYGLAEGGGGLIALQEDELQQSKCLVAEHPEVVAQVKELAGEIEAGTLTVEDPMFAQP